MAIPTSTPANAELTDLVEDALNRLHIPPSLLGYSYLTYCISQVVQDPLQVKGLTKRLYREVARRCNTDSRAVERDVRTAILACWNCGGRETLDKMASRHFIQRPWATEFIAIVAQHVRKGYRR